MPSALGKNLEAAQHALEAAGIEFTDGDAPAVRRMESGAAYPASRGTVATMEGRFWKRSYQAVSFGRPARQPSSAQRKSR